MFLKLSACAIQQKGIGGFLGSIVAFDSEGKTRGIHLSMVFLGGGNSNIFFLHFHRDVWEMIQFDSYVSTEWFNHHLASVVFREHQFW